MEPRAAAADCQNCPHPQVIHGEEGCRVNGCFCREFRAAGAEPPAPEGTPVSFVIPPGFGFSVSFYPLDLGLEVAVDEPGGQTDG